MSELNYNQDLAIDESALDLEWLGQPLLMLNYTEASASARREVDRIKEKLNVVKAELGKKIRTNPEKYGITKITNDAVEVIVLTNKEYKQEQEALIDAQYEQQMMQGAVSSVEQRKTALENLVKLHGQQYFAGPKIPRDLSYEVKQEQKTNKSNSTIRIKRKK